MTQFFSWLNYYLLFDEMIQDPQCVDQRGIQKETVRKKISEFFQKLKSSNAASSQVMSDPKPEVIFPQSFEQSA